MVDVALSYNIFILAGKGSYGAVYKARDRKTSELVAIKVISLCEGVRYGNNFRVEDTDLSMDLRTA